MKLRTEDEMAVSGIMFFGVGLYGILLSYYTSLLEELPNVFKYLFTSDGQTVQAMFNKLLIEMTGGKVINVSAAFILFVILGITFFVIGITGAKSKYKLNELLYMLRSSLANKYNEGIDEYNVWRNK